MSDSLADLGREAVACEGWRWLPGMLSRRWAPGYRDHLMAALRFSDGSIPDDFVGRVPDLSDPATLGCLLALVREAWGPLFRVHTIPPSWDEPWGCYVRHSGEGMDLKGLKSANWRGWTGVSEAEALVRALQAAPPRGGR